MQIVEHPIVLFIFVFIVSTNKLSEAGKGKGCEIGIGVGGGYAAALACVVSGPLALIVCPVTAGTVAGLTAVCRRRRSVSEPNCIEIEGLNRPLCIDREKVYELGMALNETCNWQKNGDQKCFGNEGFITCVLNQWKITQFCPAGSRCKTGSGWLDRRVSCETDDQQTLDEGKSDFDSDTITTEKPTTPEQIIRKNESFIVPS